VGQATVTDRWAEMASGPTRQRRTEREGEPGRSGFATRIGSGGAGSVR
jgi:hypothetical protein